MYRFPPGRNVGDVTMPGVGGSMLPVPYNMGGMLPRDSAMGQPMPITALASALANAPSDQQRTVSFFAKILETSQTLLEVCSLQLYCLMADAWGKSIPTC